MKDKIEITDADLSLFKLWKAEVTRKAEADKKKTLKPIVTVNHEALRRKKEAKEAAERQALLERLGPTKKQVATWKPISERRAPGITTRWI